MRVGIYSRSFGRPSLAAALDAVVAHGIRTVQLNLGSAGLALLPAELPPDTCAAIRKTLRTKGVSVAAVSGTFNMIDPDPVKRAEGIARLRTLIRACPAMDATVVSLCSGTRDPANMWRRHPDNGDPEAWRDLCTTLAQVLPDAEACAVTLAVEPEVSNVVDSAERARRLLDEMQSASLGICMDGANLFHEGELPHMADVLDRAFALLGPDIVLAHAKDLDHDGDAGNLPAGRGRLDYDRYTRLLHHVGYGGAVVLHGLAETDVPECAAFLEGKLRSNKPGEGEAGTAR